MAAATCRERRFTAKNLLQSVTWIRAGVIEGLRAWGNGRADISGDAPQPARIVLGAEACSAELDEPHRYRSSSAPLLQTCSARLQVPPVRFTRGNRQRD